MGSTVTLVMFSSCTVETCYLGYDEVGCANMRGSGLSNCPRLDLLLCWPRRRFTCLTSTNTPHMYVSRLPPPLMCLESFLERSLRTLEIVTLLGPLNMLLAILLYWIVFERATSAIMGVERTLTSKFHRRPSTGSCKDMLGNHGLGRFFARLHPVTWHRIKNLHRLL